MTNITVNKTLNKADRSNSEELVICSIWEDSKVKVYIVKSNSIVLFGEGGNEMLEKCANQFSKTLEAYREETKEILCGTKPDVDFHVTDTEFFWKRTIWKLGSINIEPAQDIGILTSFMLILVDEYSTVKSKIDDIVRDNENVKKVNSDLMQKLSDFQSIKEHLEDGLYKKFTLLLNSKKAKIKDLTSQLKKVKESRSIYNESTDDSENEIGTKSITSSHSSPTLNNKRTHEENHEKSKNKKKRTYETRSIETTREKSIEKTGENSIKETASVISVTNKADTTASISNDVNNLDQETPDSLSGESECDFELKLDEDKLDDSAINDKESEEMF